MADYTVGFDIVVNSSGVPVIREAGAAMTALKDAAGQAGGGMDKLAAVGREFEASFAAMRQQLGALKTSVGDQVAPVDAAASAFRGLGASTAWLTAGAGIVGAGLGLAISHITTSFKEAKEEALAFEYALTHLKMDPIVAMAQTTERKLAEYNYNQRSLLGSLQNMIQHPGDISMASVAAVTGFEEIPEEFRGLGKTYPEKLAEQAQRQEEAARQALAPHIEVAELRGSAMRAGIAAAEARRELGGLAAAGPFDATVAEGLSQQAIAKAAEALEADLLAIEKQAAIALAEKPEVLRGAYEPLINAEADAKMAAREAAFDREVAQIEKQTEQLLKAEAVRRAAVRREDLQLEAGLQRAEAQRQGAAFEEFRRTTAREDAAARAAGEMPIWTPLAPAGRAAIEADLEASKASIAAKLEASLATIEKQSRTQDEAARASGIARATAAEQVAAAEEKVRRQMQALDEEDTRRWIESLKQAGQTIERDVGGKLQKIAEGPPSAGAREVPGGYPGGGIGTLSRPFPGTRIGGLPGQITPAFKTQELALVPGIGTTEAEAEAYNMAEQAKAAKLAYLAAGGGAYVGPLGPAGPSAAGGAGLIYQPSGGPSAAPYYKGTGPSGEATFGNVPDVNVVVNVNVSGTAVARATAKSTPGGGGAPAGAAAPYFEPSQGEFDMDLGYEAGFGE